MTPRSRSRVLPLAIAGLLLLLFLALAHLQWRWIAEVSRLERHRLETTLMMTGARLAEDLDREVARVFAAFHPDFGTAADERRAATVEQLERWRAEAPHPALVRTVYLLRLDGLVLERLQPEARRFVPGPWPPELDHLRAELNRTPGGRPDLFAGGRLVAPEVPILFVPFGLPHPTRGSADDPFAGAVLLVELDRHTLATELLPRLARDALGWHAGEDVTVAIVDPSRRGGVVYRSDPSAPTDPEDADLRLPILGVRPIAELRRLWGSSAAHPRHLTAVWPRGDGVHPAAAWQLLVHRRGGSVEQAVASLRRHNLVVSFGILGLLALTTVVLVTTTQRAQRLARQQIEFVAGVTHELHTPLTAIRAAGENLAHGLVSDPMQVRRYGELIEAEGRRLSTMVAQLLELAGIQSGRRVYRLEPVAVGEIVDSAIHQSRWLLEGAGVVVERDLPAGLPPVLADVGALRRGLQNLLENAVKYGAAGRWLGVRASATPDGVAIEIADRGPGIPRDELPRLFQPFFRGRDAAAGGVPGVGLGLALVRQIALAHGGRVCVASEHEGSERGTAFTLHLPAAPAAVAPGPEVAA